VGDVVDAGRVTADAVEVDAESDRHGAECRQVSGSSGARGRLPPGRPGSSDGAGGWPCG
jgi:hypothetical protein